MFFTVPFPIPIPALALSRTDAEVTSLSVEAALETAIRNNRRLTAVVAEIQAAQHGARAAGALVNPQVVFTPSLTGGIGGGSDTELLLQQPLEINGTRRARRGVASAQVRRTQAEAVAELRSVVYNTRAAYFELVRVRERAALSRTLLQTAEELERISGRQVALGARPALEQIQTRIEVTRARQQTALASAETSSAEAALNTLMNRPPDSPIGRVSLSTESASPPVPDLTIALRQARAQRTEIVAGGASAEAFRQETRLLRAEGIPDLTPQYRAGSITRGVSQSGFGIGITLPFLDYGSRRGRVRQAETAARAADARTDAARRQVEQEVVQALARSKAALGVLATYPQGLLDDTTQLLRASRLGYEEGKTSIVQLIEAQRTYRQVQTDFINAQIENALAAAELERATGAVSPNLLPISTTNSTGKPNP